MPKGKTHKGISKRMRRTRTGKIVHNRANRGHLMSGKSANRRRRLRGKANVKTGRVKVYTRLMGG